MGSNLNPGDGSTPPSVQPRRPSNSASVSSSRIEAIAAPEGASGWPAARPTRVHLALAPPQVLADAVRLESPFAPLGPHGDLRDAEQPGDVAGGQHPVGPAERPRPWLGRLALAGSCCLLAWRDSLAAGLRFLVVLRGTGRPWLIAGVWKTHPTRWAEDTAGDPQRRLVPLLGPVYLPSATLTGALLDAPLSFGWTRPEEKYAFL